MIWRWRLAELSSPRANQDESLVLYRTETQPPRAAQPHVADVQPSLAEHWDSPNSAHLPVLAHHTLAPTTTGLHSSLVEAWGHKSGARRAVSRWEWTAGEEPVPSGQPTPTWWSQQQRPLPERTAMGMSYCSKLQQELVVSTLPTKHVKWHAHYAHACACTCDMHTMQYEKACIAFALGWPANKTQNTRRTHSNMANRLVIQMGRNRFDYKLAQ